MTKNKFSASQAKRFERFINKLQKSIDQGKNDKYKYIFCKYENGYLFGDAFHFEYAEIDSVADHLKNYESSLFLSCLREWKRLSFSIAEAREAETIQGKKVMELGNASGFVYVDSALIPPLPEDAIFCTSTGKYDPVKILVDGKAYAYIMPISKPAIKE